jgi:hypothetical protein
MTKATKDQRNTTSLVALGHARVNPSRLRSACDIASRMNAGGCARARHLPPTREETDMFRRNFMEGVAVFMLVPIFAACGEDDTETGTTRDDCNGTGADTNTVDNHAHFVCVPNSDLDNPPAAGAMYATSTSDGHSHAVTFTFDELQSLAQGQTIDVMTSLEDGHQHSVVLIGRVVAGGRTPY